MSSDAGFPPMRREKMKYVKYANKIMNLYRAFGYHRGNMKPKSEFRLSRLYAAENKKYAWQFSSLLGPLYSLSDAVILAILLLDANCCYAFLAYVLRVVVTLDRGLVNDDCGHKHPAARKVSNCKFIF